MEMVHPRGAVSVFTGTFLCKKASEKHMLHRGVWAQQK